MKTIRNEPFLHALYFGAILLIFLDIFSILGQKIMHNNLVPFSKIGTEGLHIIFIPNNCNMCGRSKLYHEKIPL